MESNPSIPTLVADDDPDILSYFKAIFKNTPYDLHYAQNGLEALKKAKLQKYDLAFIDVNMPEMDGLQTLMNWKKFQPDTQIIIISSYSDGSLVRKAIQEGAYSYLFKPLNKMDIFSITMKCLKNTGIENAVSFK